MNTTKIIAGQVITLQKGERYLAARPIAHQGMSLFPVLIHRCSDPMTAKPAAVIPAMTYSKANQFLAAFNNGAVSFSGRVWDDSHEGQDTKTS